MKSVHSAIHIESMIHSLCDFHALHVSSEFYRYMFYCHQIHELPMMQFLLGVQDCKLAVLSTLWKEIHDYSINGIH